MKPTGRRSGGQQFLPIFFFLVLMLALFTSPTPAQQTQSAAPGYAGAEACATCHPDVGTALAKTPHGRQGFAARSEHACETCHGPGQAHAESGDKTLIKVPTAMSSRDVTAICLTCHESGMTSHWKGSVHEQRDLNCTVCHSIHQPKGDHLLKTAMITDTCATCHQPIKAMTMRTSHHPIREGLMDCTACHNPHGTDTPKMIIANSVNEQCYVCHTEKRGPFLWEHPPVRESCLNCHNPHGSNHEKLLVSKRPYLCQRCHLDTRHPGTLYDGSNLLTSNREFSRSCSNCHLTVHGSNHPSGVTFLR